MKDRYLSFISEKGFMKWLQIILSFFMGLILGGIFLSNLFRSDIDSRGFEIREHGYSFINPLLECEVAGDSLEHNELKPFKHKVYDLVDEKIGAKKAKHISVYFRDLNNGPWFGINEKEEFSPASLLKIPIMMAILKQAESNPNLLTKKVKAEDSDSNAVKNIESEKVILPGKYYTIDELLYIMIANSDNTAKDMLFNELDIKILDKTYRDLGVEIPGVRKPEDFMSVKSYASFFRVLFNASYLNKEMSEKALEYLTGTGFKTGLIAGVPPGMIVSHKFGERRIMGEGIDIKQLHDCGVIYYPGYPYLLCVMTRGNNFENLSEVIRDISNVVYSEIDTQRSVK